MALYAARWLLGRAAPEAPAAEDMAPAEPVPNEGGRADASALSALGGGAPSQFGTGSAGTISASGGRLRRSLPQLSPNRVKSDRQMNFNCHAGDALPSNL